MPITSQRMPFNAVVAAANQSWSVTYTMAMPVEDLADTFLQLLDQDRLIGPPAPCRALPRPTRGTRLCLVALAAVLSILLLTVIFGNTQNTPQSIWEALWLLMASVALTTVVVMFWATIGSWVKSKIVSEF